MFESPVTAGAVAASLEEARSGVSLVGVPDGLESADLGDDALVEGIAAWERVMAWGLARQAELVSLPARRATGLTSGGRRP